MNSKQAAILSVLTGVLVLLAGPFAAPTVYPDGLTIREEGVAEGYVMFGAQGLGSLIRLVDVDGNDVHTWAFPCGWQGPARALANGNALTKSCGSMMEMDWGGTVVWEFPQPVGTVFHHDWDRLPNGNTLILCRQTINVPAISPRDILEDFIIEVSPAGEIVWEWHEADHFDEFGFSQERRDLIYALGGDWSHANAIAPIPVNTSHGDPRFSPGNIVMSVRHQNTVAVIDRATDAIVWTHTDSVIGPHTTNMIPDDRPGGGNILVFDNGFAREWSVIPNRHYSRVVEIDPVTGLLPYDYTAEASGLPNSTMFSSTASGAQRLLNGNTLITEARTGRIFEVLPTGEIVWEYVSPHRSPNLNFNNIYRAYKVPLDWAGPQFVPDLVVSGDGAPNPVDAGAVLTYLIGVENAGADPAVNVELAAATPAGTTYQSISAPVDWSCSTPAIGATGPITCTTPSLSAGSAADFNLVVTVGSCGAVGPTITNTASVSSLGSDATPADNSAAIDTATTCP